MSKEKERGRPLPKFGDWDVNDPASAEGFSVIFSKARDEKKTGGSAKRNVGSELNYPESPKNKYPSKRKKWLCCG